MTAFYLVRLIDPDGGLLASEQVWTPETAPPEYQAGPHFTPERVAQDAAAFFTSDDHGALQPDGCTVQLFGPFTVGAPAHAFAIRAVPDTTMPHDFAADALRLEPDPADAEAGRIGGGTANAYLSELLAAALERARSGLPLTPLDLAAIDEAETRIGENCTNDDCGDYFGPGAVLAAKGAGYTVNERAPGVWVFNDPDGNDDDATHDSEGDAWDAAAADLATRDDE